MEEKNIIKFKKEEFAIREHVRNSLGKGKVSRVKIEYTPVGEKIMANKISLSVERLEPIKFKVIAYKTLQRIMNSGALGAEIRLSGKLPGARAKTWRFAQGYLKKTGDSAKVVDRAQATAQTKPGTVGVKVSILSPYAHLTDKVNLDLELINKLKARSKDFEHMKIK